MRPIASRLEGKTVGKWQVLLKRKKTAEDDSGAFSSCYNVKNAETGQLGFLKAFNYLYAFRAKRGSQSADIIKELAEDYTYERDLLLFCEEHKMRRIVTAIDHGEYEEPSDYIPVPYLVFEVADGSLKNVEALKNPDIVWRLRSFHGCLVGLSQLHSKKIAHQDIKPSNILIFGGNVSKISDLGNSTQLKNESPNWNNPGHCGDMRFSPIELMYGHYSSDWHTRRFGADLFMVGGIVTYLITGYNFLILLINSLEKNYRPNNFGGTFEQVKPHLMNAYHKTLNEIEQAMPESIRRDLIEVIAQLSHPVPEERGNPQNVISSVTQYSLQRYISIVDRLTRKVEFGRI